MDPSRQFSDTINRPHRFSNTVPWVRFPAVFPIAVAAARELKGEHHLPPPSRQMQFDEPQMHCQMCCPEHFPLMMPLTTPMMALMVLQFVGIHLSRNLHKQITFIIDHQNNCAAVNMYATTNTLWFFQINRILPRSTGYRIQQIILDKHTVWQWRQRFRMVMWRPGASRRMRSSKRNRVMRMRRKTWLLMRQRRSLWNMLCWGIWKQKEVQLNLPRKRDAALCVEYAKKMQQIEAAKRLMLGNSNPLCTTRGEGEVRWFGLRTEAASSRHKNSRISCGKRRNNNKLFSFATDHHTTQPKPNRSKSFQIKVPYWSKDGNWTTAQQAKTKHLIIPQVALSFNDTELWVCEIRAKAKRSCHCSCCSSARL